MENHYEGCCNYKYAISVDWFWQTALPIRVGDTLARVLGPEAQVIHLCGHIAVQHGGLGEARLVWLHDLAEVISLYRAELDWDLVVDRARACDLVLPVRTVLNELRESWRVPVSPSVLEQLAALRPSTAERRFYELLTGTYRPLRRYFASLMRIPGWGSRLSYVWYTLFPSLAFVQERYRVPCRLLVPLYYPYRWLRSLRRVQKG